MQGAVILGNNYVLDPDSGQWVNAEHQRIAELINDFDDTLTLAWIPPAARTSADTRPYAVMQDHPELPEPYVVMYLAEDELDHRVIARLYQARMAASGNLEAELEAARMAQEALEAKKRLDEAEEAADKARFLWNTPLHSPTMDGKKYRL